MASKSRINIPEAGAALDNMKYEVARELGVNLKQGYNGDLTARENGYVGGNMTKKMVAYAEQAMSQGQNGAVNNSAKTQLPR